MDEHFLFYAPPDHITDDRIVFPEEEAHHIATVLRKKAGDVVQATDGVGNTLEVRLDTVDKKAAAGEVTARFITPAEPDRILAMGVIRQRERLEFAIEKAVELGVTRIVLVHSEYAGKMEIKARRIEKTIITAMKQSRRPWLPGWEERDSFFDVLAEYGKSRKTIMAHSLEEGSYDWQPDDTPLLLMVGPEGGFSPGELEHCMASGVHTVSFGPKRLRTETAVCVMLTLANYR